MLRRITALALSALLAAHAFAAEPANLYPGVTTSEILATAPIHWVSVPMIAASLDGKPPMVVGFDIDDPTTIWE